MIKVAIAGLAFCAATLAPFGAWADTWTDESGNEWTYSGGKVTAVSFETTNLTIPDTLGGNPVTAFNADVFAGKTRAVRVTIPETVTAIPAGAFAGCGNLKSVTILGEGLTSIGATAFKGCGNLAAFVMPNSVTFLGLGAFSGCSAMESVTLSDGLTELIGMVYGGTSPAANSGRYGDSSNSATLRYCDNGLFYNCTSLKTVNWGANIKTIGNIAFLNCSALESVTIPDTVTTIGYHAFLGCSSLTNVKIGNGVTEIGRMAFRALPNLTKVTFGSKVNEIGVQAFQDCVNLQNFTLPDTIQYLRYRCFAGCSKALTEVTIPANRDELETELGEGVFSGCSKLETVTFGDTVKTLTGMVYGGTSPAANSGRYGDSNGSATLSYCGDGLFYNCASLKTVNWGAGIKTVGNVAFLNCSALESVEIPDTVTSIGYHAFLGCSGLTNVKIGNGVTTVGRMAFRALPNLTRVTFGLKVNEIGVQAFQDCVNLQNFTLPDTIQYLRYRCFAGCNKALTEVTIPANRDELETELEQGVFSGCSKLETVTFGDTVKTLTGMVYGGTSPAANSGRYGDSNGSSTISYCGDGLFYNCASLKTVNWGAGIKTIGNIAFLNCSALTDLVLPANITDIGNHAFFGCASLKTVVVEGNVNSIGRYAFGNCNALHYVDFRGATMTSAPGYMPFAFDRDAVTVYAASGSTGWTGVAEVGGLPESGTWGGARITYAPPPEGAGNPYDFYLYTPVARVNYTDYNWPAPLMLTTNRYVHGKTVPVSASTIREGDPVFLTYAFDEYWRGEAFDVTNRFTLSGAKSGTFEYGHKWEAHATYSFGWKTNASPELLQNLAPGDYTLTLQLNADNALAETDYANNTASITFTVVSSGPDIEPGDDGTATYINWGGPYGPDIDPGSGYAQYPGCTMLFTVQTRTWTYGGNNYADYYVDNPTGGVECTVYRRQSADEDWGAIATVESSIDGWNWFTDYDVTPGATYTYEIRTGDINSGPIEVTANYTYRAEIGENEVVFDKDEGERSVTVTIYKETEAGSAVESPAYFLVNLKESDEWIWATRSADNRHCVIYVDENDTGAARESVVTIEYDGFTSPIQVRQKAGNDIAESYTVTFHANGGTGGTTRSVAKDSVIGSLPVPTRDCWTFLGWFTAANGGSKVSESTAVTADVTYYAHWVAEGSITYALHGSPAFGGLSSAYKGCTYNGYALDGDGLISGTFVLAVKKPAKGKTSSAATLTFTALATGKKTKITGTVNLATGDGSGGLAGLTLGANAVGGTVAKVGALEGGADAAKAKDAAALSVLSKFSGKSYVVALVPENPDVYAQGGCSTLAVTLAAKGKAKVSGVLADGTKVTASGVMTVGDAYCCVPVIYSKKSRFGFVAWFDKNTRQLVDVTALMPWRNTVKPAFTMAWEVAALGAKSNVTAGARTAELDDVKLLGFVPGAIAQTPFDIPLKVSGTKWDAGKAAKVAYKGGAVTVTGTNVSGLKLTYTAKTGLFKGSFVVYAVKGGKLVKSKFSVFGAVTGGVGYGTAVLKGKGSAAVYVE